MTFNRYLTKQIKKRLEKLEKKTHVKKLDVVESENIHEKKIRASNIKSDVLEKFNKDIRKIVREEVEDSIDENRGRISYELAHDLANSISNKICDKLFEYLEVNDTVNTINKNEPNKTNSTL